MKILNKLTLFFAGFGTLAGVISGVISASQKAISDSAFIRVGIPILLAILFLYAAYKSAVPALKIVIDQLPEDERKKIRGWHLGWYGFWPYITMWLVLWIVVYTYTIALQLF
jgi:hypothetical protein